MFRAAIFGTAFLSSILFSQESYSETLYINCSIDKSEVEKKIFDVENSLSPAIIVQGTPYTKVNLNAQINHYKIPAVSIAVINDGVIEWAKSYGEVEANGEEQALITTLFQSGSVSKPVASFGTLLLVQNGVLDLDEDVNQKLTSWKIPDNAFTSSKKVTLKDLMSHTSGFNVIGFNGYKEGEQIPTLLQILNGEKPANNSPIRVEFTTGKRMSYSGGGYTVMQQLVEDCIKLPFSEFMDKSVFKPLGMSQSTMSYPLSDSLRNNAAKAHPGTLIPMQGSYKTYPESAAAGLWTTPSDLCKWLIDIQNTLNSKSSYILNVESIKLMLSTNIPPYGLGSVINGKGENLNFCHKGRTDGFACGFVSFPYLKKAVVIMTNSDRGASLIDEITRGVSEVYEWPSYKTEIRKELKSSQKDLLEFPGRYGTDSEKNDIYDALVINQNDELYIKFGTSTLYKLHKEAENKFFLTETGYEVLFLEENGLKKLVVVIQEGFDRHFNKFH